MCINKNKRKPILALLLSAAMLLALMVPTAAAQKISNPGKFGAVDGVAADPNVGKHNSYVWCTELFEQTDADYLWIGMNRDLGQVILGGQGDGPLSGVTGMIGKLAGIPDASPDKAGKIYRQRAGDNDAPWELVYENPAITGYRRMILFKGSLYVCAGLSNAPDYDYSVVLRFKPDFKLGDKPEIVLWENLPRDLETSTLVAMEYFRAACVYQGKLYIGTFDSKIFVTDGTGLKNLTPQAGPKDTGWELFLDLRKASGYGPYVNGNYIWDMLEFKGSLYAFVTNAGFHVFKITLSGDGKPVLRQIVGNSEEAKYPNGVGLKGLVAASPFRATFGGKDYIYVTTFANGPAMLANLSTGKLENFVNMYSPPSVFRFDATDNWEVVVGDTTGEYIAKDKAGKPLPKIGNQRAGFFPGDDRKENTSFNQYIWWMAQYDGKLYVSTWDLGVFKKNLILEPPLASLTSALESSGGGALPMMKGFFKPVPSAFALLKFSETSNPGGFDLFVSEDGKNFSPVTVNGFGSEENYGGRVLLPTKYGLFLGTANPFGGGQVWRLDAMKKELQPNIPAVIRLKVGETFRASLRSLALPKGTQVGMEATGGGARLALEKRSEGVIVDRTSRITNVLGQYIETPRYKRYPTQMYDILFTGEQAGTREVTLRFSAGGVEATRTVKVIVA